MSFLGEAPESPGKDRLFQDDLESDGYVGNLTRVWAWRPDVLDSFMALRQVLGAESTLSDRDRAVLVSATAAARGDSYCALAWGTRLAGLADEETAVHVLAGGDGDALQARDRALATWARRVVQDPNDIDWEEVARLREAGLGDREIFEATALVAFRLAFSTINDALGAPPDAQLAAEAPEAVRRAVDFGRAPA